jgi:hypothetical protein
MLWVDGQRSSYFRAVKIYCQTIIEGDNINTNQVNLGMPVFASFGSTHIDNLHQNHSHGMGYLARTILDKDVSIFTERRALLGKTKSLASHTQNPLHV